jgi:hypothetical protein
MQQQQQQQQQRQQQQLPSRLVSEIDAAAFACLDGDADDSSERYVTPVELQQQQEEQRAKSMRVGQLLHDRSVVLSREDAEFRDREFRRVGLVPSDRQQRHFIHFDCLTPAGAGARDENGNGSTSSALSSSSLSSAPSSSTTYYPSSIDATALGVSRLTWMSNDNHAADVDSDDDDDADAGGDGDSDDDDSWLVDTGTLATSNSGNAALATAISALQPPPPVVVPPRTSDDECLRLALLCLEGFCDRFTTARRPTTLMTQPPLPSDDNNNSNKSESKLKLQEKEKHHNRRATIVVNREELVQQHTSSSFNSGQKKGKKKLKLKLKEKHHNRRETIVVDREELRRGVKFAKDTRDEKKVEVGGETKAGSTLDRCWWREATEATAAKRWRWHSCPAVCPCPGCSEKKRMNNT